MTPALLVVGVLGLMVGSFLNVCITRLPVGESVIAPRSRCRGCRVGIPAYDNIPVLSYLLLGGRCRVCGSPIGARYPAVELVTSLAFVAQALVHWPDFALLLSRLVLTALLIALFWTDWETERLPNALTIPGIVIGILLNLVAPPGVRDSLAGAALGAGVLWLVRSGWRLATGVEGMGLGDVKMLALVGAFLGWSQVLVVLFLASVMGALVGVALILRTGRSLTARVPFGTFLAASAFVASLAGDAIFSWYVSTLG
jgi:leader peptidase (prepilin peptidase)/N-methyltransferase